MRLNHDVYAIEYNIFLEMAHSKCIAFYLLFNSFSKRMCQNFEFISIWFSIIYFALEMSVRLDSLEPVHFVELFSTSHISKTDVCVVFHFSLLRASTRGYLLLCVSCARNICFIRGVKKRRHNSLAFHQNKSHG